MRNFKLLTVLCLFIFNYSFGQDEEKYAELTKTAWNLYVRGQYLESAETYSEAFVALGNKGRVTDRYNAACSYALANKTDSAFVQLFVIAEKGN